MACCPNCLHKIECDTQVIGIHKPPKPGDLAICLYCAQLLQFDEQLDRVPLSPEAMGALHPETQHKLLALRAKVKSRLESR